MAFEIGKTIGLIKGGILDRKNTWNSFLADNPPWLQTAAVLTGPMLLANIVLTLVFSRITGTHASFGYGPGSNFLMALVMGIIMAIIGFAVGTFIFSFLAGKFGGKPDFDRTFAAFSMASIPAVLAGIVGALIPGIGVLISLAGGIVTLVFLYEIIPLALAVPDEKRTVHFVVSIIAVFIVNLILVFTLGLGAVSP